MKCACGCGEQLSGREQRFHTRACAERVGRKRRALRARLRAQRRFWPGYRDAGIRAAQRAASPHRRAA